MNTYMVHGRDQAGSPVKTESPSRSTSFPSWRNVDHYFAAWAFVLPISCVLILPPVQGTTPAYLFALSLLLPPLTFLVMRLDEGVAFPIFLVILYFFFFSRRSLVPALRGIGTRSHESSGAPVKVASWGSAT